MKKIPTLFERIYIDHKTVETTKKITKGMEWVLQGEGIATVKIDGACCAIINQKFYRRYDCKKGKQPPHGFIPCCDPDKITGHWPGWIECNRSNPDDKWFWNAYDNYTTELYSDGTYEATGLHFQSNPYNLLDDILIKHGEKQIFVVRTFEGIKKCLSENYIEGLVFWKDGEPQCKIKRSDFGFEWNNK